MARAKKYMKLEESNVRQCLEGTRQKERRRRNVIGTKKYATHTLIIEFVPGVIIILIRACSSWRRKKTTFSKN